ncbi:hypothetical protein I4U23_029044 [Adineta vaga]|nr:hypothetical protein I4U23_029044 [Adineta vaga]
MEIVYAMHMNMTHDEDSDLKHILTMDISCLNILSFSCSYLSTSRHFKYSPHLNSSALNQIAQSSFCVYICALEQPWHVNLITTSNVPINGCINTMDCIYQYETHEDILSAKYIFPYEPVLNLTKKNSFHLSVLLFKIHTLPLDQSLSPTRYCLSQNDPLNVSICDIYSTDRGFNMILSEHIPGALVHFFVVHYISLEPQISYTSYRLHGFRIPSCYGTLQSLVYFQRHSIDCILIHMKSFSGDLIDLYEYNNEQEEWISTTLLNSSRACITSISLSKNQLISENHHCQGLFGRQILLALNDGSIIQLDKLNLKSREQFFPIHNNNLIIHESSFFVRIQHTYSGSCCVGFTQNGYLFLLRTINLDSFSSSSSLLTILVHLLEQYIIQLPCPCDIWDILSIIPKNSVINQLIDRVVINYESQSLEFKRTHFIRFKECLYHLHRLACPLSTDSCEHLTSLLVYHVLLIVRDYLRLFIYEPTNRNFVDATKEILQQSSFIQNIDQQRIKYLGDQENANPYQLISFTLLVNWITDIIVYCIGFLRTQRLSSCLSCKNLFNDPSQLQWLRELLIYFYILNRINRIPNSKIAQIEFFTEKQQKEQQQQTNNVNQLKDILKDMYHSLTKYNQILESQQSSIPNEQCLNDLSILDIETLLSKIDSMFPKQYPFLIPNSSSSQLFSRTQPTAFMIPLNENFKTFDHPSDTHFDIITLGKMSLASNRTFRRAYVVQIFQDYLLRNRRHSLSIV